MRANFDFAKLGFGRVAVSVLLMTAPLSLANAADMAVKAPPPVVAPVPAYNWTSCYIGGYGGGLWAHKDWNDVTPGGPNGDSGSHSVDGGLGGFQGGCDYQAYSNIVLGLGGNFGFTNAKGSNVNQLVPGVLDQTQINSLAAVTARLGVAMDRMLAYVKGGAAWERDHYALQIIATGQDFSTANETRGGYTVGLGLEYAFSNCVTGFAEYDYYGFGTRTITFPSVATDDFAISERKNIFVGGLNFRYGQGSCYSAPAPVVTKG